jgi:hypothetical protein
VAVANAAATRALKQLARELAGSVTLLAAAVQLSDVMTALLYHSRTVQASGWSVPYVGSQEQQGLGSLQESGTGQLQQQAAGYSSSSRGRFMLKGLWPFWMVGADSSTIKNDVELDGFMLLTGPNMAGRAAHMLRSSAGTEGDIEPQLCVCLWCLHACMRVCATGKAKRCH